MVSPVQDTSLRSPWARLAFGVLSVFWLGAAWLVLLDGGFHKSVKYSTETTFVGGLGGGFMAVLFLVLSFIAGLVASRGLAGERLWCGVLVASIVVPVGVWTLSR